MTRDTKTAIMGMVTATIKNSIASILTSTRSSLVLLFQQKTQSKVSA